MVKFSVYFNRRVFVMILSHHRFNNILLFISLLKLYALEGNSQNLYFNACNSVTIFLKFKKREKEKKIKKKTGKNYLKAITN